MLLGGRLRRGVKMLSRHKKKDKRYFFHIADVENERARIFFVAKITKLAMQKKRCLFRTYHETTRQ